MEIDINQQVTAVGDKYKVFIEGQQTYSVSTTLGGIISLYELHNDRPKMTMDRLFYVFKPAFDLTRSDGSVLYFRTPSFWNLFYECWVDSDYYTIYEHRGRKCSVFKNGGQVAWWDKKAVAWFAGDNHKIIVDADADKVLLITFCLVVDYIKGNSHHWHFINIDLGNLISRGRKFDHGWQPK